MIRAINEMTLDTTINPRYAASPDVEAEIKSFVSAFESSGETIFQNRRNTIKMFAADSLHREVVVKRYGNKGLLKQFFSLFKKSKAQKAFDNGLMLEAVGIATPEPIAYVNERSGRWMKACYSVTAYTPDTALTPLLERPLPDAEAVKALARLTAAMHDSGIVHRDLNSSNVLQHTDSNGQLALSLIDINRMRHRADRRPLTRIADYAHDLLRFTGRLDVFLPVAYEYARLRGFDAEPFVRRLTKMKIKHDANWTRRKKFTRLFH